MEVLIGAFVVVFFLMTFGFILRGILATSNLHGKLFRLAEKRLDEQLSGVNDASQHQEGSVKCAHCGNRVSAADKCPHCGAGLV